MGTNKSQRAAAERAKTTQPAVASELKAEKATPAAAPSKPLPTPVASKKIAEMARFQEALKKQGTDLSQQTITEEPGGKYTLVVVGPGWPTAAFGPTGGLTIRELKSYTSAFEAGLKGKELWDKQKARDAKKVAAATPTPAPAAKATAQQSA